MTHESSHDPTTPNPPPGPGRPRYPLSTDSPAGSGPGRTAASTPAAESSPANNRASRTRALAIGGFIFAATGALLAFIFSSGILGLPVLVVGLVLSVVGLLHGRAYRRLAIAGLVVALVALPVGASITAIPSAASSTDSPPPATAAVSNGLADSTTGDPTTSSSTTSSSTPEGCSSDSYSSGDDSTSGYSDDDLAYLAELSRAGVTVDSNAAATAAIDVGHGVCRYLKVLEGGPQNLTQNLLDAGYTDDEAGAIIGAALDVYCP